MGVISALLRFGGINYVNAEWFESHSAEILGLVMFLILCGYLIWESLRSQKRRKNKETFCWG